MENEAVTVSVLNRKYKLKVSSLDEPYLRKAAELIDSQARNYGSKYAYHDYQDLLSMVALTQITQFVKLQDSLNEKAAEGSVVLTATQRQQLLLVEKLLSETLAER